MPLLRPQGSVGSVKLQGRFGRRLPNASAYGAPLPTYQTSGGVDAANLWPDAAR